MGKEKKLMYGGSLKHWTTLDMGLFKFSMIVFTLFLISVWPQFTIWVIGTHWAWFLAAWVLLAIPPLAKYWKK